MMNETDTQKSTKVLNRTAKPERSGVPKWIPEQEKNMSNINEEIALKLLPSDLRKATATMETREARYLVDTYYQMQDYRMASSSQVRSIGRDGEPHATLDFFGSQFATLEKQIKGSLKSYAEGDPLGVWAMSNYGIGPVIAAGLLAHIDISKAPTVGHIWAFAGLDPTRKWEKGQKRPHNAKLKVLCWKIGESFKKFSGRDDCYYGKLYQQRKTYEVERDEAVIKVSHSEMMSMLDAKRGVGSEDDGARMADAPSPQQVPVDGSLVTFYKIGNDWFGGGNAKWCEETLRTKNIKDADTLAKYRSGHLPAGRLDMRAARWATKLFLAHYHGEGYRLHFGEEPPLPYPIAHLGHAHMIHPAVPSAVAS